MYDNSSIGQSYRNAYTEHAAFQAAQNVRFDFTLLFEQTILSILPSAIFLLCTPLRLYRLQRATVKTLPDPILSVKAVRLECNLECGMVLRYPGHCCCVRCSATVSLGTLVKGHISGKSSIRACSNPHVHQRISNPYSIIC